MSTENVTALNELLALWKAAHEKEDESSCQRTFPKSSVGTPDFKTFRKSFCPDGYLSESYNNVLIICRESNVSGNEVMGEFSDTFAMQKKGENMNVYFTFIKKALKKANKPDSVEEVKKCAYMNLNKRGGYGTTNHHRLANYVKLYEPFIKKEIELLSPEIIICGGTYNTVKDWLPENATVLDCYHPSARSGFYCKKIHNPQKS